VKIIQEITFRAGQTENKENLLFWNKVCFNYSVKKRGKFCSTPWMFCCFCFHIPLFGWLFPVCLPNLIKFQVPYISAYLCPEKLHFNYFQGLGNTLPSQQCELRYAAAFQNRQHCGLSTVSLALSFFLIKKYLLLKNFFSTNIHWIHEFLKCSH
jgi:hypothetical protein